MVFIFAFLVITLGCHPIAVFGIIDLQTVFHEYVCVQSFT